MLNETTTQELERCTETTEHRFGIDIVPESDE